MSRGNKSRRGSRGGGGGVRGNSRGGQFGGRGRGSAPERGRGAGRGRGGYIPMEEVDYPIQMWNEESAQERRNGYNSPRGRGRGGNGYDSPFRYQRGLGSPRGRGRGRGSSGTNTPYDANRGRGGKALASKLRAGVPLSKVLYEDRPLLRPITFVRSVYTATLFQQEEELLQPISEDVADNEESHVPTADKVTRVFEGNEDAAEADEPEKEQLEEIDFAEIARVQAEVDAAAATINTTKSGTEIAVVEEKFTGFYVDTKPSPVSPVLHAVNAVPMWGVLGGEDDDDDIIVYDAPHPRAGPITSPFERPSESFSSASILTGLNITNKEDESQTPSVRLRALAEDGSSKDVAGVSSVDANEAPTEVAPVPPAAVEPEVPGSTSGSAHITFEPPAEDAVPVEGSVVPITNETVANGPEKLQPLPAFKDFPDVASSLLLPDGGSVADVTTSPTTNTIPIGAEEPQSTVTLQNGRMVVNKQPTIISAPMEPAAPSLSSTSVPAEVKIIEIPTPPSIDSISFSFAGTPQRKQARRVHPVHTPRSLIASRRIPRRKAARHFGSYGAMLSEAHLREEAAGKEKDPRRNEQRRGDSDVDWGDDSDEEEDNVMKGAAAATADIDEVSSGMGAMDLDGDVDIKAMQSFVQSMSAEGSRHVTMDDIADIDKIRNEDEEEDEDEESDEDESSEEDGEMEAVFRDEERVMVAEAGGEDESEDDEDDSSGKEEESPRRRFQKRVEKVREKVRGKQRAMADNADDENSSDVDMEMNMTWADNDEEYIAQIQAFLDANEEMLSRKDRKQRNQVFRAVRNGDWDRDEYEELMGSTAKRMKDKDIPTALHAQWQKDRAKKAESKRKRAQARLEAAADPLSQKNGGKKGMKAMLYAARLDATIEIPNRVVDLISLEQQIRRFLADIGGRNTMTLPPANKDTRKKVHELALAFNLKSLSKGNESKRYTTLTKTTMSGININEKKVRRIMRTVSTTWEGPGRGGGGGRGTATSLAKHREGEEVGKAAPKIGESNIGFQMLAAMGWSEGDRIGLSGGLAAPLTAVMKKTKLGLGATLER